MDNRPNLNAQNRGDYRRTGAVFGLIILLGIIVSILPCRTFQSAGTSIIWVLACLTTGAAIGFLFGIPKILQGGAATTEGDNRAPDANQSNNYQQQVNTNLTEISDWLTKIIVGLSLINLGKFPPILDGMASTLAAGMNPQDIDMMKPFAYGVIVCFSVLGFLFGYLTTRLFLAGAFSRADQRALQQIADDLESTQMQVASIRTNQGVLSDSVYPREVQKNGDGLEGTVRSRSASPESSEPETPLDQLVNMANQYLELPSSMQGDLLIKKDRHADEMANFIMKKQIRKEEIVQRFYEGRNEGLVAALATVVNIRPEERDFNHIADMGKSLQRPHVKYRMLIGLSKLATTYCLHVGDRDKAIQLARSYRIEGNTILNKAVDSTVALMRTTKEVEE